MPEFIAGDRVRFLIPRSGDERTWPLLLVAAGSVLPDMPAAASELTLEDLPEANRWRLMARLTLCVLDGPGDTGMLMAADVARPDLMSSWCDSVERAGGAFVLAFAENELPALIIESPRLVGLPRAQGAFVRSIS
jgi:hypothetical protein